MAFQRPLLASQALLALMGVRIYAYFENRIPLDSATIVVSNHRSFLDPLILMAALQHPLRTACHHYMGEVPLMRELVEFVGAFPLADPQQRQQTFLRQAIRLLQSQQWVAIFPEGAQPMVSLTSPLTVGSFHRGFAHLALKANVPNLAILPVAIASWDEFTSPAIPLRFLRLFDPSEPLFDQSGWHPVVTYRRANVLCGQPYWLTAQHRQHYRGRQAKSMVAEVTQYCHQEIESLLNTSARMQSSLANFA
jgi:1-acyl-sn-glycerol-3-phosphate acyltransferase